MCKKTVGDKGFAVIDGKVISFSIDFVGKDDYLMDNHDGSYISCPHNKFFETQEQANTVIYSMQMACVCREVNKSTGEVVTYKINMEVTSQLIFELSIRGRYNLDLDYFCVLLKNLTPELLEKMKNEEELEELITANIIMAL